MLNGFQLNSTALNSSSALNYIQAEADLSVITSTTFTANYVFEAEVSWDAGATTVIEAFQHKFGFVNSTARALTSFNPYQIWAGSTAWEGTCTAEPFEYLPVTNGEGTWFADSTFVATPESTYGDIDWQVTASLTIDPNTVTPIRVYWNCDAFFTPDSTAYLQGEIRLQTESNLSLSPNIDGDSGVVKYAVTNWAGTAEITPINALVSVKQAVWFAKSVTDFDSNIIKPAHVRAEVETTITIGSDRFRTSAAEWQAESTCSISTFNWLVNADWSAELTPINIAPYIDRGAESSLWAFGFGWSGEGATRIRGVNQNLFGTSNITITAEVLVPAQTDWVAGANVVLNASKILEAELYAVAISTKFVGGAILSKLPAPTQRTFYVREYTSNFYVQATKTEFKEAA